MTKRKGLIWDYDNAKAIELVGKLRFQSLDTIRNRVHIDDVLEEYYSACVFMMPQTKNNDAVSDYEKLKRRMPTIKIAEAGIENIDYIADFLRQNNCKQWNLKKEVDSIAKEIFDFLADEIPLIDLSEPYPSVVAAGIAKKALEGRACRFVFFDKGDRDIDSAALDDFFEECEKYFGTRPVYIDIKKEIATAKIADNWNYGERIIKCLEQYEKIYETALYNIFGESVVDNGIIEDVDYPYSGCNRLIVNRYGGFWHPASNIVIRPCARLFAEELYDVAKILELPEKLINSSKLFKKI